MLAKEEVLRPEGCFRSAPQDQESEDVFSKSKEQGEEAIEGQLGSHGIGGCHGAAFGEQPLTSGGFSGSNTGRTEYLRSTGRLDRITFLRNGTSLGQVTRPTRRMQGSACPAARFAVRRRRAISSGCFQSARTREGTDPHSAATQHAVHTHPGSGFRTVWAADCRRMHTHAMVTSSDRGPCI